MPSLVKSMAKLLLVHVVVILGLVLTCSATLYIVGGTSGWDTSTDLDTWAEDKKFVVGDVLLFQYSSSYSVNEVTKESFEGCNTTNVLQSSSNGNTSYTLSRPGDRYFICGNKLYCLGGMKLHANVEGQGASTAAAAAPAQAESGASLPQPSSKSNNPSPVITSSAMFIHGVVDSLVLAFMGFMATLLWVG